MQTLQPNTSLQGGRYKILKTLGQGGFGITYLAVQSGLDRQVAVKEFFMKELCDREASTSRVTIGTEGSRETVNRYRAKFLKEATNIAKLNHPNIVRVLDVFEENGTAYYVMEYAEGGSLADKLKAQGAMSEKVATRYIKQVAAALGYIHQRKMNHLDVKPGNIMLSENDDAVLIDFGLAKQYDAATGGQTSTTPVGISEGYAPMEQYKQSGVASFSPETDIYALGATFFKLLTGTTPPSASDIMNDGVPLAELKAKNVSTPSVRTIEHAMEPRTKDRFHSVADFIQALEGAAPTPPPTNEGEVTVVIDGEEPKPAPHPSGQKLSTKTFHVNGVSFDMVRVEAGTFTMGATPEMKGPYDYEKPAHEVTLTKNYYIGKTVVTQALWKAVMGKKEVKPSFLGRLFGADPTYVDDNPSIFNGDNRPLENVSWDDCQTFISRLNAATGKQFRLPTEAEWEFAARGGKNSMHYQYSGSNKLSEVAWFNSNSKYETHEVAQKQPNELGLYDMSGNVWEWCQDWYGKYSSSAQTNPTGPNSGSSRVNRGGSWYYSAGRCRSSYRDYGNPDDSSFNGLGLRLALSE